ncbi:MAG TPA: hypothetical protein VMT58_08570 [Candidatus Binataceae bacterium]|nr:hypothetical protein [Candidatus Binataceae bacterium]
MSGSAIRIGLLTLIMTIAAAIGASRAGAQMGPPLPTTLVVSKPAPGQTYGDKQTVTMGVKGKTYKFVLKDAWVTDPAGIVHWPDVWQQVSMHKPNFKVVGLDESVFKKIQPGQTLTINGMYTSLNWNFEVTGTELGNGPYAPGQHY